MSGKFYNCARKPQGSFKPLQEVCWLDKDNRAFVSRFSKDSRTTLILHMVKIELLLSSPKPLQPVSARCFHCCLCTVIAYFLFYLFYLFHQFCKVCFFARFTHERRNQDPRKHQRRRAIQQQLQQWLNIVAKFSISDVCSGQGFTFA